jgi:hypothetical protein
MKDPCIECLVRATCSSVCDNKRNYGTLINIGLQQLRASIGHNSDIRNQYLYYTKISKEHNDRINKIRANKISKIK